MKYLLLMYGDQAAAAEKAANQTPEEQQAAAQPWYTLLNEMQSAGVLVSNNGLSPASDATTVRVRESKTLTTDGPFVETHEQLGGFFILDCADLDEAISWAAKIPSVTEGAIEIRTLWGQE